MNGLPRNAKRPSTSIRVTRWATCFLARCARRRSALTRRSSNTDKRTRCGSRRSPRPVSALCGYGQEHYEQAAEKCQKAKDLDPEFPDAYHTLGAVRAAQERLDEAIEQYRQADSLWQKKGSKARKRALWNWAGALRLQGHHEEAAEK